MKALTDEKGTTVVLVMSKKEAQKLFEISAAAKDANKRKTSFQAFHRFLEEEMACF